MQYHFIFSTDGDFKKFKPPPRHDVVVIEKIETETERQIKRLLKRQLDVKPDMHQ